MEASQDHEPAAAGVVEEDLDGLPVAGAIVGAVAGLGPGFLLSVALGVRWIAPWIFGLVHGTKLVEMPHFRLGVKVGASFLCYVILVTASTWLGWKAGALLQRLRRTRQNPDQVVGVDRRDQ